MPIVPRREASKGCGFRPPIGCARASLTSHEWRGSPPTGRSASMPTTFGKYLLNFLPIDRGNKRRRRETEQPPAGLVMLKAIDKYACGVFGPDVRTESS